MAFLHFLTLLFTWHAAFIHWLCRNHWHDLWTICRRRKGLLQPAASVLIKYCASRLSQTAEEIAVGIKVPMNLCSLGLIRQGTFLVVLKKNKKQNSKLPPIMWLLFFKLRRLSEATVPICGAQLSITLKGTCRLEKLFCLLIQVTCPARLAGREGKERCNF